MGHANLKFWKAWLSPDLERRRSDDFDRSKRTLIVVGKVEVAAATQPSLEEVTGRTSESRVLWLVFRSLEVGTTWKPVWFQKEIKLGEYEKVRLHIGEDSATGGDIDIE